MSRTTDIVAVYEAIDTNKIFHHATKYPVRFNESKLERDISNTISNREEEYEYLKKEHNVDLLSLVFELTVSELGLLEEVNFIGVFSEAPIIESLEELVEDLDRIIRQYTKFMPGTFLREKVKFRFYEIVFL